MSRHNEGCRGEKRGGPRSVTRRDTRAVAHGDRVRSLARSSSRPDGNLLLRQDCAPTRSSQPRHHRSQPPGLWLVLPAPKASIHRSPHHRWTNNHIHDINAVAPTLPNCDVAVTDREVDQACTSSDSPRRTSGHDSAVGMAMRHDFLRPAPGLLDRLQGQLQALLLHLAHSRPRRPVGRGTRLNRQP